MFCFACHGTNLIEVDGAFVCNDCGTQSQVQVEESEFDDVGGQGSVRRRLHTGTQRRLPTVVKETLSADDASKQLQQQGHAYLHCLQAMLQAQSNALSELFGVAPETRQLVRRLWFLTLPHTELLDLSTSHSVEAEEGEAGAAGGQGALNAEGHDADEGTAAGSRVRASKRARPATCAERSVFHINGRVHAPGSQGRHQARRRSSEPEQDQGQGSEEDEELRLLRATSRSVEQEQQDRLIQTGRAPRRIAALLSGALHPHISLVICFLACALLRQPVTVHDVIRAALNGQLPYLKAPKQCHVYLDSLPDVISAPIKLLLAPEGCGNAADLLLATTELAALLKLTIPPLNGPLLLYRACTDLVLPQAVWVVAAELYGFYLEGTPLMSLTSTTLAHSPYSLLMAVVVVATHLCYGLGDPAHLQPHFPHLPAPPVVRQASLAAHAVNASPRAAAGQEQPGVDSSGDLARDGASGAGAQAREGQVSGAVIQQALTCFMGSDAYKQLQPTDKAAFNKAVKEQPGLADARQAAARHMAESGWQCWAQARVQEYGGMQDYPLSTSEAVKLSRGELLDYVRFLRLHIADERTVPASLSGLDAQLQQLGPEHLRTPALPAGLAGAGVGQAGVPESQEAGGVLPATQDVLMLGTQAWDFDQATTHMFTSPAAAARAVSRALPVEQRTGLVRSASGPQQPGGTVPAPQGTSVRPGHTEVPAGQNTGGIRGRGSTAAGSGLQATYKFIPQVVGTAGGDQLHPDLLAVISACSVYVNVQPRVLLRLAALLEKHMSLAEARARSTGKTAGKGKKTAVHGIDTLDGQHQDQDQDDAALSGGVDVDVDDVNETQDGLDADLRDDEQWWETLNE